MFKITSVEPQKKNLHRFNIFLDGEFVFGADEDLVVEKRLVIGKTLTTSDVEQLLFEKEVGKLMERMYRLFSIRARSEKEIRDYLKNLSFKRKLKDQEEISQSSIEFLIERLKQKRLIDDLEFAKVWVDARRKSKQKGQTALKSELFQKGISREIIDQVLSEKPGDEEALAEQALEKKFKSWKNLDKINFKKKAYEFLSRRRFGYEIISKVVAKVSQKM